MKRHAQELRATSSEGLRIRQTMEDVTSLSNELSGQGIRESEQRTGAMRWLTTQALPTCAAFITMRPNCHWVDYTLQSARHSPLCTPCALCSCFAVWSEIKDLEAALHEVMDLVERFVPLSQFQSYMVSRIWLI